MQKEACKDEEAVGSEGTMATQVKGEVQSGPSGSRSISGCDWLQQISGTCLSSLSRTVQKWLRYNAEPTKSQASQGGLYPSVYVNLFNYVTSFIIIELNY